jgi:hypothetical protein
MATGPTVRLLALVSVRTTRLEEGPGNVPSPPNTTSSWNKMRAIREPHQIIAKLKDLNTGNTIRPHRGLDVMTPSSFAELHRARRK